MVGVEAKTTTMGMEDFLDPHTLELVDQSVAEVFGIMLGFATEVAPPASRSDTPGDQPERMAIVGFSGAIRGSCGIRLTSPAALAVASAMLGGAALDPECDSIDDAVGELCNMLAGGWKGRIPMLDAKCMLSPPAVISGCDYRVHLRSASVAISRTYRFQNFTIQVTIVRDCEAGS